ncbi:helix-turn-helix domain-containing protein [Kineococcus sp. NUM-3379]
MRSDELLLHPVRLRIAQAFLGERTLTTGDLRRELPDVPAATLYRHVALLAGNAVLEVEAERRVRGTVERTYRLRTGAASLGPDDVRGMDAGDHRRGFLAFAATLLADFDRYLDAGEPDLARDQAGYRQVGLHLSDAETAELVAELRAVVERRTRLRPAPGRRRRVLSTVLLPADTPADTSAGGFPAGPAADG